jgi:hypothetical protein
MQFKRKLLSRYWWFIVLLLISAYFFISNINYDSRRAKEHDFSVQEISQITKIVISDGSKSVSLNLNDGNWFVNDDFVADANAIEALLRVVTRIQPGAPVPLSVNDSLVETINEQGLHVELFAKRKVIKSYKVLSTSTLNLNGVGVLRGSKTAYQLELPNYEGDIVELFITNLNYWQSNQLALPALAAINAVEVEIPEDQENSFRIDILNDDQLRLFALFYGVSASNFDTSKVEGFLTGFSKITYNEVVTDFSPQEKMAILYFEPDFIYTLYLKNGEKHQIKVFPIPVEEYLDELGRPVKFDLNRLYLSQSNDESLYIVNYLDLHKLLRNISYFNPNFKP